VEEIRRQHYSLIEDFSSHPAIKEQDQTMAMLSMLNTRVNITRSTDQHLSFLVYRKPTHTDQYLQFSSNQPLQHKQGVINQNTLFNIMIIVVKASAKAKKAKGRKPSTFRESSDSASQVIPGQPG